MFENLGGGKQEWINDGFCDDMNNNEACNYDGGDCCGMYANKRYCLECTCKRKFCHITHTQLLLVIVQILFPEY